MKRMISCLLAVILALLPCQQAIGAQDGPIWKEESAAVGDAPGIANLGQVDVTVISALRRMKQSVFTVSLTGQPKQEITLEPDKGANQPERKGVTFSGLAPGKYTLDVTAPGFARYSQDIQVTDQAYGIKLMTGFVSGYDFSAGKVHPGVILIGDVDGDGAVNGTDKKLLTDSIDAGSKDTAFDLNGDGDVDLADLEYFTKGYEVKEDVVSTAEIGVPASMVSARCGDGTIAQGDMGNLLAYGGTVRFSREDGKVISESTPVTAVFEFQEGSMETEGIVIEAGGANPVETASVSVEYNGGQSVTIPVPNNGYTRSVRQVQAGNVEVTQNADGTICIDLKQRVAVKRVTFTITKMQDATSTLAEISKVTFIGDMASRIPEPAADVPEHVSAVAGNASFTMEWKDCANVTGYEVYVTEIAEEGSTEDGGQKEGMIQVSGNTLMVSSFFEQKEGSAAAEAKIENYTKYKAKVRSVNGLWRSAYSEEITVEPRPTKLPDAPDNVSAAGKYKAVNVSWKKMKDSVTYNVYYKKEGDSTFTKAEGISENSFEITGLEDRVKYIIYVTGVNHLGEGKPSLTVSAVTKDLELAKVPRYKILNGAANGEVSPHIVGAVTGSGTMQDSPKDTDAGTAWGSVDSNPGSYYLLNSWDGGGFNNLGNHGLIYEFDKAYKMKMIALQEPIDQDTSYGYAQIAYWDEAGRKSTLSKDKISVQKKADEDGRVYYMLRLVTPITAKKIQIGLARSVASGTVTVSEVYFYHYDPIEDDIMALYTDDLHTVLRSDVTQNTIDALRVRVNTKEDESGEYHPDKDMLERELETAEQILNETLNDPVRIHSGITTNDVSRGFGGLNAWQPIGVTAAAGETITVYVGHSLKRTGDKAALQLISTQYHSESSPMFQKIADLKIGRNEITIPKLWSVEEESGGALYAQYTGNGVDDDYAVRVNGGAEVPILDLYQVADETERLSRISTYLTALDSYVSAMPSNHEKLHKGSSNKNVQFEYDERECILGATDILLDTMMLSLPAAQVINGTNKNANTLLESAYAMEDMMNLFYQHKGLNKNAENPKDKIPSMHQNIRYQRMFAGAFMYASGNHIGIEYNETAGMVSGRRVSADENGKWSQGQYFGWGIAHEIGHCINQGAYSVAEITNNYFSVLAQARDTNGSVRFKYEDVYQKVTSNTTGRASNVFTQLGMYWQLHLAYDKGYNYKTYEDHEAQLANLFFARVDTYARTPEKAPKPITLSGDKDQDLMRLSCAAADRNILEFFKRWGMVPDQGTIDYANQFEEETRAIYYACDDARAYQLSGGAQTTQPAEVSIDNVTVTGAGNTVSMKLSTDIPAGNVLGYEIARYTTSKGQKNNKRELVAFVTPASDSVSAVEFQDTVTAYNNRAVTYEVTLIDKYLGKVATKMAEPVKISHESYLDKRDWTISTNNFTVLNVDTVTDIGEAADSSCGTEQEAYIQRELQKAIDNNDSTAVAGTAGDNAEIVLELNRSESVTAFCYRGSAISSYELYARDMNGGWVKAASGSLSGNDTVYFAGGPDKKNIAAYQTTALRFVMLGQNGAQVSISELDALGVCGDNIEFGASPDTNEQIAVGKLASEFRYGPDAADVISPGAIVFVGSYKGNPAFNVAVLYTENGEIVSGKDESGTGKADSIILADIPENGPIQDVSDGTWIYWIDEPYAQSAFGELAGQKVRAELYRVDNAQTNENERLVSDTLYITVPSTLEDITFKSGSYHINAAELEGGSGS